MTKQASRLGPQDAPRALSLPTGRRIAWGHLASGCALILLLAWIIHAFAVGQIAWTYVARFLFVPSILRGFGATLIMAVCAMGVGMAVGLVLALGRLSMARLPRTVCALYIWIFRGVPVILQLLLWFNLALIFPHIVLPGIGSFRTVNLMTPFLSALLGLGFNQAAYIAEIFRAGFQSIDEGQYEAASAIGMTRIMAIRRICLPQAFRNVIPPLGNEFINMIKLTSLASIIQYPEVLHNAETIYYANTRVIELLIVSGFWYLLAVTILTPLQTALEHRFARGRYQ